MKPSNEKEENLAVRAKTDAEALGRLFGRYQKTIDAKVSRMLPKEHWEDGGQEAYLALYQAVRHFDSSRKVKFSTYANRCIDNALRNYQVKLSTKKSHLNASSVSLEQMRPEEEPQAGLPSRTRCSSTRNSITSVWNKFVKVFPPLSPRCFTAIWTGTITGRSPSG